jgi:hypothetical protein
MILRLTYLYLVGGWKDKSGEQLLFTQWDHISFVRTHMALPIHKTFRKCTYLGRENGFGQHLARFCLYGIKKV